MAAHLVLNWHMYTGEQAEFNAAVTELVRFTQKDVRGKILRKWLFGLLSLLRVARGRRWSRVGLLEEHYAKLFRRSLLESFGTTENVAPPALHILSTSLTTGDLCSFSDSGIAFESGSSHLLRWRLLPHQHFRLCFLRFS